MVSYEIHWVMLDMDSEVSGLHTIFRMEIKYVSKKGGYFKR